MNPFFDHASSANDEVQSNNYLSPSSVGLVDSSLHLNVSSSVSQVREVVVRMTESTSKEDIKDEKVKLPVPAPCPKF